MKDAKVGGAWAWHQDYGYWYQNGVLEPLLTSVFIAVDPCTRENGCLQMLRGSHYCGRIDHVLTGDQAGADCERVEELLKRMPLDYVEMGPGDALFFHPNLLHRSDRNRSDHPRWAMICCYNAARNDPYKESHHPCYTPLAVVSDAAIKAVGVKCFADDATDVAWLEDSQTCFPILCPRQESSPIPFSGKGGGSWTRKTSNMSRFFETMSKRRKGFPSETKVKRGVRFVHGHKELTEKLGRNDLCPCGSGRRLRRCCLKSGRF